MVVYSPIILRTCFFLHGTNYSTSQLAHFDEKSIIDIHIMKTRFLHAEYAAIHIENSKYFSLRLNLSVTQSLFRKNAKAIDITRSERQLFDSVPYDTPSSYPLVMAFLHNSKFESNSFVSITIVHTDVFVMDDCYILNNKETAVQAYFSDVTLSGTTSFVNNTGEKGGALSLYNSYLLLGNMSTIAFENNYADDVGGAIYVYEKRLGDNKHVPDSQNDFFCFYQLSAKSFKAVQFYSDVRALVVNFVGNIAKRGGDNIYGGKFYSICTIDLYGHDLIYLGGREFMDSMFHFNNYLSSLSSISSDPTRVCLCDDQGIPKCVDIDYIHRQLSPRYPGEVFSVSAVVVGFDFGTVPGIVHAAINETRNISLREDLYLQELSDHRKCSLLYFAVQTNCIDAEHHIQIDVGQPAVRDHLINFDLTLYKKTRIIPDVLLYQRVMLNLLIERCPNGFILTPTSPYICTCHYKLEYVGIKVCIITNHTGWVYRSGTVWVSSTFTENDTNSFVVHQYCPYDYCKQQNISVQLQAPDKQCAFHHSGILCGGCYGNLSLALGSSRCLPCDNRHVSLLIVFIIAGLALVLFIKLLDFTVARGTINGLIFYANIVWANKSILFSTVEIMHPIQHILYTFIAWLNLDLGIETCFFNGLDAYWKTWLQFVFPLYIWSITGAMIITARYSTRASKLFGNNSVPVLATLILLSYTKLLRTIITSLGFSVLDYPHGTRVVWSFDGNISYFGAAHSILLLVALAALLLLWLPYTIILLTLQWLRRKSNLRPLRWINRWKPFFDAYFGQLKPNHHYWIGLLLLVRVLLLVLFAATSAVIPRINILAIVFVGMALFIYLTIAGLMYKSLVSSLFEVSFSVNLTILAVVKLYTTNGFTIHDTDVYTSVGIALLQFCAIVVYHTYIRIKTTNETYKRRHMNDVDTFPNGERRALPHIVHHPTHYREPLLESSGQ